MVYIQVQNFPRYKLLRHENWGWVMSAFWVIYTSFPMPTRAESAAASLDDASLDTLLEPWQEAEAMHYNHTGAGSSSENEDESDEEDGDEGEGEGVSADEPLGLASLFTRQFDEEEEDEDEDFDAADADNA